MHGGLHMSADALQGQRCWIPGTGDTHGYELPYMSDQNPIGILCKHRTYS